MFFIIFHVIVYYSSMHYTKYDVTLIDEEHSFVEMMHML